MEANSNLLQGMSCPECGSTGPFYIRAELTLLVHDDHASSVDPDDFSWDDTSYCECQSCKHNESVREFREDKRG